MPGGGTWTVQNKVRAGAYLNFVSVPKAVGTLGSRGVVAVGLPMSWGPINEIIRLTGDELLNGASLPKIGVTAMDTEESLPFRVALSGCYTALLFRTDVGGVKATAVVSTDVLEASAKYPGTVGNKLTVAITKDVPDTGSYTVKVLVGGLAKETFAVTSIKDFKEIESQFIDFDVKNEEAQVPESSGVSLAGGTNGEVSKDLYATFWGLLDTENFQSVTMYNIDKDTAALLKAKVDIWRSKRGKKIQAVVREYTEADDEGVISTHQGFKTSTEVIDEALFSVWVASQTAGAEVNESLTAMVVEGAVEIIKPVLEDEIEAALNAGKFILSYRQDGAVCVEKDINTLHNFTQDKNYAFSKNRVIRCLDEVGNSVALTFNRDYAGKVDNNEAGRVEFKAELITLLDTLQEINAIQNFNGADDITILPGESVDSVVVDLTIQPVDSMEKLYMVVNVNA